jgi:predicted ATPase/tetratricopeptide (TPR) repeat protein/DNA-binding XRE family transcriptional regulator
MFAQELTRLRQRQCLSQEELALATGVSVRTISNLERAATRPRRTTVRALADGLGLSHQEREDLEATAVVVEPDHLTLRAGTLPAPAASIVGREDEAADLARRLTAGTGRLVIVTGPGGVGKSRLALDVAWRVAGSFDRVDAVDVSTLRDRDEVMVALAAAVGEPASAATVEALAARVGDLDWLLVADSLEHVPDVTQDLEHLVRACPRLRILGTSRLRTDGGWPLAALPVPAGTRPDIESMVGNPAVQLLAERARAVRPTFAVTPDNAAAVASLCRRLDGLPLAIEIAAGHLQTHDIDEIEADLAVRVTTLRADAVDVPGRHRTLRAMVEWSTDRLAAEDRVRFAVLGAFRGPVPYPAWEAVLAGSGLPADGLSATLARLDEVSLVSVVDAGIVLLDTVREVAEDLLRDAGLDHRCRTVHAGHMLDLVRTGDPGVIDSHVDNVRAAVAFAIAQEPAHESADESADEPAQDPTRDTTPGPTLFDAAAVGALAEYLRRRGRFPEAHRVLVGIAEASADPAIRAVAFTQAGIAANLRGDPRGALELAARATREGSGSRLPVLNLIGSAHKGLGELDAAHRAYAECLDEATAAGDVRFVTVALNNLGTVAHDRGAYEEALQHYERSLAIKRGARDTRGLATALLNLGGIHSDLGDHERAREHLVEAVRLFREMKDPYATAFALALLAAAEVGLSRWSAADRSAREALALGTEIENAQVRALAEMARGDAARLRQDPATAVDRYRAALAVVAEPYERARILARLATVGPDREQARAWRSEADEIRRSHRYAIPPVDQDLTGAPPGRQYSRDRRTGHQ